jgi:HK97 gp10 family phage protein
MSTRIARLEGWKDVQRDLKRLPYMIDQKKFFIAVFRKAGQIIRNKARDFAPVKTGQLKKAIKVFVTGKGRKFGFVTIGVKIPKGEQWEGGAMYGQQIEFGTSKKQAMPFMRPGFAASKSQVKAEMITGAKAIVARALKGLNKGKRYYQWKI